MNPIHYLIAGYVAVWVIHGTYIGSLLRRYARLKQQRAELARK